MEVKKDGKNYKAGKEGKERTLDATR